MAFLKGLIRPFKGPLKRALWWRLLRSNGLLSAIRHPTAASQHDQLQLLSARHNFTSAATSVAATRNMSTESAKKSSFVKRSAASSQTHECHILEIAESSTDKFPRPPSPTGRSSASAPSRVCRTTCKPS